MGVTRNFQRGVHTMSYPGYLHGPLLMFGPANGIFNYLALEKIDDGFERFRQLNY